MALPSTEDNWLRKLALSISIAQFSFIIVYRQILGFAASPWARYSESVPPSLDTLWALLLDVSCLALLIFVAFILRSRGGKVVRVLATAVIVFFVAFAAFQLLQVFGEYLYHRVDDRVALFVKGAIGLCLILFFLLKRRPALRALKVVLLLMAPLYPIAAADAIVQYGALEKKPFGPGSAAGMLRNNTHENRIIWIIFDELDQGILFRARPSRIHLDEFDALRAESLYATNVISPNPSTAPSLQSLILGRTVGAFNVDSNDMDFQFQGCNKWEKFSSSANVFSRARAAGFDTALSGWYHPYCRVIGNDLSECAWAAIPPFMGAAKALQSRTFFQKAGYIAEWQAESFPLRWKFGIVSQPGGTAELRRYSIQTFQYVMSNAEQMLCNPHLNLILLHVPAPHPPGIWDPAKRCFTTGNSDYVDNLQMVDEALGRLRHQLEASGEWDKATILVSSDHPYRSYIWESMYYIATPEMQRLAHTVAGVSIPFLLKLPHQHSEVAYTRKFNSVVTSRLLEAVLAGEISTPQQASTWLDRNAALSVTTDSVACQ